MRLTECDNRAGHRAWRSEFVFPGLVALAFALAISIRIAGIGATLPMVTHPDEPRNEKVVLRLAEHPLKSPRFFLYPSVFFYIEATVARAYEGVTGSPIEPAQILSSGDARVRSPGFWVIARATTVIFGAGIVAMAVWLGAWLSGSLATASVVGLWTATSPLAVEDSRYITPDTYAAFFTMAAILGACKIAAGNASWKCYAMTGALVGLAGGSKYNVAVVALSVVVAHLFRTGRSGLLDGRIWLAGGCAVATFIATTPFALFDYAHFRQDLTFEAEHYKNGHPGAEGMSLWFNVVSLWNSEGLRLIFVPAAALVSERRSRVGVLTIATFAACYFGMLSSFEVHFIRNLVPLIGPVLVIAGIGLGAACERVFRRYRPRSAAWALSGMAVLLSVRPALSAVNTIRSRQIYPNATVSAFIAQRFPRGSHIAVEPYGPWVDPVRFQVMGIGPYADTSMSALEHSHTRYLVLAEGSFGRYYAQRRRYARAVAKYEVLFHRYCELARFDEVAGNEIRILDLSCIAPRARREGARR